MAYATRSGSTREVAEAIVAAIREAGPTAEIGPLSEVDTLEGYQAVVVGAPLYMFRWHKDALKFLKRHREALQDRAGGGLRLGSVQ